jgi:alcohol dehydrogenase class IV
LCAVQLLNTLSTAVEALESPKCDPVSEAMLMHALRLATRHLNRMAPEDITAREYLVIAGVLCGRGTEQAGGGLPPCSRMPSGTAPMCPTAS